MRPLLVVILTALTFCLYHANAADIPDPTVSRMRSVIQEYTSDLGAIDRRYELPGSQTAHDRLKQLYDDRLQTLDQLDFDKLDQAGRVDYVLLASKLRFESKQLEYHKKQFDEASPLLPFADSILALEESRRQMQKIDPQHAAGVLVEIQSQLKKTQKDLESKLKSASKDVPTPVLANRAARLTEQFRDTLRHWHAFYADYDPQFTWWMREPFPKADKALDDYAKFLRKRLAGYTDEDNDPVIGDPIGREALLDALQAEMIPYTPEELIDIANREFAWCDGEMKRAATDLGCDGDWKKALEKVVEHHVAPGDQPQLIHDLAEEATKYVEDNDLVTVPPLCKETVRMEMMSPQRQKVAPYFLGGELIRVSYPTDTMSYEDKLMSMRGNNYAFSRATVFHELIPGHHLQGFMAQRYNAHRRIFSTPFLIEGWALYWEMRFWDMGFPRTPEERVGMLFWRAHRCARIIFSLKFHLGQMSAQEAIDFLVDRVGHERRNATAEVRRSVNGEYGPLYQCAYMLGALQLRALHRELVDSGKMKDRDFNDAILRENAIPITMIRASLTNQPLMRDFKPEWKFYDDTQK